MNSRIVLVVLLLLIPGSVFAQDNVPGAGQDQAARSGGVAGAFSHTKTGEAQPLEGVVAGATYGLGIGLLADALHKGSTTSYRAPHATSMTIVPYAAPRQAGARRASPSAGNGIGVGSQPISGTRRLSAILVRH